MLRSTKYLIGLVGRVNDFIGAAVSWLTIILVLVVVAIVVTRYFLHIGSIALQESVTYLHATIFMLGIAYTMRHDGHVRVDIFYRQFSPRHKALVNIFGGILFLIPVSILIVYSSWEYAMASWSIAERSVENNGLPFVYLLKMLILVMPMTLIMQGIADILQNLFLLNGLSSPNLSDSAVNSADQKESDAQ